MGLIGTTYQNILTKVLHRTGYKAFAGGKIVTGCGECCHNMSVKANLITAHQCDVSLGPDCKPLMIFDPYDVPEFCCLRIVDDGSDIPTLIQVEMYRKKEKFQ
jgi:hypothetical protein